MADGLSMMLSHTQLKCTCISSYARVRLQREKESESVSICQLDYNSMV